MKIEDLKEQAAALLPAIRKLLNDSGFAEEDSLEQFEDQDRSGGIDLDLMDLAFLKLESAAELLEKTCCAEAKEERLFLNEKGYFQTTGGRLYSSGSEIEALIPQADGSIWVLDRVEFRHDPSGSGGQYVLFDSDLPLSAVELVRVRKRKA